MWVTNLYVITPCPEKRTDSAKTYEKLSKFVKVTAKILSVLFSGHGVYLVSMWANVRQDTLYRFSPLQYIETFSSTYGIADFSVLRT